MIRVTLKCGGACDTPEPSFWLRKNFRGLFGNETGVGQFVWEDPEEVAELAATGWVVADPYTQTTYCPKCWAEIEAGIAEDIDKAAKEADDDR